MTWQRSRRSPHCAATTARSPPCWSAPIALERETGKPIFPIEERPVPPSDVSGEQLSPTQPIPLAPPPWPSDHASACITWASVQVPNSIPLEVSSLLPFGYAGQAVVARKIEGGLIYNAEHETHGIVYAAISPGSLRPWTLGSLNQADKVFDILEARSSPSAIRQLNNPAFASPLATRSASSGRSGYRAMCSLNEYFGLISLSSPQMRRAPSTSQAAPAPKATAIFARFINSPWASSVSRDIRSFGRMNDDRTDLEVFQFGLAQDAENFRAERIVPAPLPGNLCHGSNRH